MVDNGLLRYGDFRINLAAGREDTLVYEINPVWNVAGRRIVQADEESEKPELTKDPKPTSVLIPIESSLQVTLGQAYYNQGFFNIPREQSDLLGPDTATIEIQLGGSSDKAIQGYINRTANKNGTPRIMGGKELRNWVKENFTPNGVMTVDILWSVAVRLR